MFVPSLVWNRPLICKKNLIKSGPCQDRLIAVILFRSKLYTFGHVSKTYLSYTTFKSFLAGVGQKWMHGSCCSAETTHKLV